MTAAELIESCKWRGIELYLTNRGTIGYVASDPDVVTPKLLAMLKDARESLVPFLPMEAGEVLPPTETPEQERDKRYWGMRRTLIEAAVEEFNRRGLLTDRVATQVDAMLWVDAIYQCIVNEGWAIHRNLPVCDRCKGELEQKYLEWQEGAQERKQRAKRMIEEARADSVRFLAEMEAR